jgi:hypothetical protein
MLRNSVLRLASVVSIASACFLGAPAAQATALVGNGFANGSENFLLTASFPLVENPVPAGGFTGSFGGNPFLFWCADLTRTFSFGTGYDYTPSLYTNTNLSRLFTEVGGSAAATATTTSSAAFQLAIWEILFEGTTMSPYSLGTGDFKVTNDFGNTAAVTQANAWLLALGSFAPSTQLVWLSNDTHQNFITDATVPGITLHLVVPEPLPLSLVGLGLLAMIFVTRRQSKQAPRI